MAKIFTPSGGGERKKQPLLKTYLHKIPDSAVSKIFPTMISLPIFPSMTEEEQRFVADSLIDIIAINLFP